MALDLTYRSGNNVSMTTVERSLAVNGGSTTLQTSTAAGFYTLVAWSSAVAKGDEFKFRIYEKASTGATKKVLFDGTISDAQAQPYVTPSIPLGIGWDITLQRTGGSNRAFWWSIRRVS